MKKVALGILATCALATPQTKAIDPKTAALYGVPVYAAFCVFTCLNKESKEQPDSESSVKTLRSMKVADVNWWKNIWKLHDEWVIGQRKKDPEVKPKGDTLKISRKKCPATGVTGKALGYIENVTKTRKTMVDIALIYFAINQLTHGGIDKFVRKALNWKDDFADKDDKQVAVLKQMQKDIERIAIAQEKA
jgi:hypothetical protein